MTKYITTEQHQMLEDLTGLQHTRTGQVRKYQNRLRSETIRLGLRPKKLNPLFERMLMSLKQ